MIPKSISNYLEERSVDYRRHPHYRAVSAQMLASSVHMSGYRVAKSLLVDVDGERVMVVLPAAELLDLNRFATFLGADAVSLVDEEEIGDTFTHCELGAEPPFGGLYGLRVYLDQALAAPGPMLVRAGSHEESIELSTADYIRIERPTIAQFGRPFAMRESQPEMTL